MKTLEEIATCKIKTSFIGALAEFETAFSNLWGNGTPENQWTDEQRKYRALWQEVRRNVLDRGNLQLRALLSEIDLWTITPKIHKLRFSCKGDE